jgi:CYTH domain-containing protein
MFKTQQTKSTQGAPQSLEIERRWLVAELPLEFLNLPRALIRQGYLTAQGAPHEVRIRAYEGQHELTVKVGMGISRTEIPISISAEQFNELWPATIGARIEKLRTRIAHHGNIIDLDLYTSPAGLLSAEVEFPSVELAEQFVVPSWFGREVTDESCYRNRGLAS